MNPFISLLAGVAGAAVYDHFKGKGSMAKHRQSSYYAQYDDYVQETYQPLLDQLESELQMAAQAGDEGAYVALQLEMENVKNLMDVLVRGLIENSKSYGWHELPPIPLEGIETELNEIAKGKRPLSTGPTNPGR